MKLNKYIIYLLKVLFGFFIIYLVYTSISSKENLKNFLEIKDKITFKTYLSIGIVFILQFLNWAIEALKFRYIISKKELISINDAIKAVYVGNATGIFTPDKLGNFIGRFLYFKNIDKTLVTSSTLLGNFTQLIATITFSLISSLLILTIDNLITIPLVNHKSIFLFTIILWSILMYLYFNPIVYLRYIYKIKWVKKQKKSIQYLQEFNKKESLFILYYSCLRYLIFVLQFYILLTAFGLSISLIETLLFSGLLYLFTTLIPSPLMGNLGTREYISILLLSAYKYPEAVLVASLTIWIINIAIPSLIGSFFLFKLKHIKV